MSTVAYMPAMPTNDPTLDRTRRTTPAQLLCQLLDAAACSVYVHRPIENRFVLSSTHTVADAPARGLTATFSATPGDDQKSGSSWLGLTSFVAWSRAPLLLEAIDQPKVVKGTTVRRDGSSCEIDGAGPFMAVPVEDEQHQILGVVRVIRKREESPFTEADLEDLLDYVPWVRVSFAQAQARADLIRSLFDVVTTDDVKTMLGKIEEQATRLVGGEPSMGRLTFEQDRATLHDAGALAHGLSAHVIRTGKPFLSTDLPRDVEASGNPTSPLFRERATSPLFGFVPTAKGEGYEPTMRSFVGVPVTQIGDGDALRNRGVLRVSSPYFNAFSYHDLETLEAVAHQTSLLLAHRERLKTEERKFHALIKASPQPIVAVDRSGRITEFNEAAQRILGLDRTAAMAADKNVVDVVYGGNLSLARATGRAINAASTTFLKHQHYTLRNHYTVFYRDCPKTETMIPIPVRLAASRLVSEDTGAILGSIGFFEDLRLGPSKHHVTMIEAAPLVANAHERQAWLTLDVNVAAEFERVVRTAQNPGGAVLITGPTGSGKEGIARALHHYMQEGRAADKRGGFAALNCAGLNESIVDVELFGSEPHMYTGAPTKRSVDGIFKKAANGTVFLDEISTLSLASQAKLLRSLGSYDEIEVRRVGSSTPQYVKVQVVAATNEDLSECVRTGRFRQDLYERLKGGGEFTLPALADRSVDILLLADLFLSATNRDLKRSGKEPEALALGFSSEAVRVLLTYPWPGNIRELEYVIRTAALRWADALEEVKGPDDLIEVSYFPPRVANVTDHPASGPNLRQPPPLENALSQRLALIERELDQLRRNQRRFVPFRNWLEELTRTEPQIRQQLLNGTRGLAKMLSKRANDEGVHVKRSTAFNELERLREKLRTAGAEGQPKSPPAR